MSKIYSVKVTEEELEKHLSECFSKGLPKTRAGELSKVIIKMLGETPAGSGKLFKAIMGMDPFSKYKTGQFVNVKIDKIYSWNADRDLLETSKHCYQGYVKGQIKSITEASDDSLDVEFTVIKKDGKEETATQRFSDSDVTPYEDDTIIEM
jgi:hypothetical protein